MQIVLKKEEEKEKKETKTGGVLLDSACGCCKNEINYYQYNFKVKISGAKSVVPYFLIQC